MICFDLKHFQSAFCLFVISTSFAGDLDLYCPPGSIQVGRPPPWGTEIHCEAKVEGRAVRHGGFKIWHTMGNVQVQGHYDLGKKDGVWNYFAEDGMRVEKIERYAKDQLVELRENLAFNENNEPTKQSLKTWSNSGSPLLEGNLENGKKEGHWKEWGADGKLFVENYWQEDLKNRLETIYYPNGKKKVEQEYWKGQREGRHKSWHANGKLHREGQFKEDKKNGLWKEFDAQGGSLGEVRYRKGEVEGN